jgi:hypothetical protein
MAFLTGNVAAALRGHEDEPVVSVLRDEHQHSLTCFQKKKARYDTHFASLFARHRTTARTPGKLQTDAVQPATTTHRAADEEEHDCQVDELSECPPSCFPSTNAAYWS